MNALQARGRSVVAPGFNRWFARGWLAAGYAFLFLPIVALVAAGETALINNAAENYNRTPEMIMSSTFTGAGGASTTPVTHSIDSIISLPPIF